jgi:catechol 2,3-dioxygenase-like lactoylglutathione lyase family enzyme/predicted enzyme related to lactoylglutathione lyase
VGAVHWIDHYAVPTNDLGRHLEFVEQALGGRLNLRLGLTTQGRIRRQPIAVFHSIGHYHSVGGFLQERMLPEPDDPGAAPRIGFFARRADLAEHIARLERVGVPHTGIVDHADYGEDGWSVYFRDHDGNQYELWAPAQMPAGAMESDNTTRVGRISHAVLESRDVHRAAEFYVTFCGMQRIEAGISEQRVALKLLGGGLLVLDRVDVLSDRTGGHNHWRGQHLALTVDDDDFVRAYERFWDALPESDYVPYSAEGAPDDERHRPPRTELHGLQARGERDNGFRRGTFVYDWDGNNFHLVGGTPLDGGMTHYELGQDEKSQIEAGRAQSGALEAVR